MLTCKEHSLFPALYGFDLFFIKDGFSIVFRVIAVEITLSSAKTNLSAECFASSEIRAPYCMLHF